MAGDRHHTDARAPDLPSAMHAQPRVEEIDGIDEDEGSLERAVRAVQVELDELVAASIQGDERRRRLGGGRVIEQAGDQHDPALEKLLLEPGGEPAPPRGHVRICPATLMLSPYITPPPVHSSSLDYSRDNA